MRNIIFLYLIALLICSCTKVHNTNSLKILWESSEIKYSSPKFYMDGFKFESKVVFVHKIMITNNGFDTIEVNLGNSIYELYNGNYLKLSPLYNNGFCRINPNDSAWMDFCTPIKFTTKFNPKTINDSIYKLGDSMIKISELKHLIKKDTFDIERAKTFNTVPEKNSPSTSNKIIDRVTL